MTIARTRAVALSGMMGTLISVEADLTAQLPGLVLIGLPDTALAEARERVRSAAVNSGCPLPARRITINLSPASLPKHGSSFDLAIAIAALAAAGAISIDAPQDTVHLGELGLDGQLRPVPGVLPSVYAAARAGMTRVIVPYGNVAEARLVSGIDIHPARTLAEVIMTHGGNAHVDASALGSNEVAFEQQGLHPYPECERVNLDDVVGQPDAVDAVITAAAGGHHTLLLGPPGSGKTMLANALRSILPPLTEPQALEVAALRSVWRLTRFGELPSDAPFEQPHHTASTTALCGGGQPIRPGAASLASHGVLFLDEATEFRRTVLDALREPMETGYIALARGTERARYPAQFQLVLAANPCPCGKWGSDAHSCDCPPMARRRYLGRLSGPLLDRIDVRQWVAASRSGWLASPGSVSGSVRERVALARTRAAARLRDTPWQLNRDVSGSWLRKTAPSLDAEAIELVELAVKRGTVTMRGADRVLRVAWTCADLDGTAKPNKDHVRRAFSLRDGAVSSW